MSTVSTIDISASGAVSETVPMTPAEQAAHDALLAGAEAAHAAAVTTYAGAAPVGARARTTDATPTVIYRFPCELKHVYSGDLTIIGIDAGNGAIKDMLGRFVWKRLAAGAIFTGVTIVSDIHDSAAASWIATAGPSGNEILFSVTGAAGRTI